MAVGERGEDGNAGRIERGDIGGEKRVGFLDQFEGGRAGAGLDEIRPLRAGSRALDLDLVVPDAADHVHVEVGGDFRLQALALAVAFSFLLSRERPVPCRPRTGIRSGPSLHPSRRRRRYRASRRVRRAGGDRPVIARSRAGRKCRKRCRRHRDGCGWRSIRSRASRHGRRIRDDQRDPQ